MTKYFTNNFSVINLYKKPSVKSEVVTQMIYGESFSISKKSKKAFVIIGVGGIQSSQDAIDKIKAGADLIQIYTGFIYKGPGLIKKINKSLLSLNNN